MKSLRASWLLCGIPVVAALWVWLSPLSFVPVPWPDDSAFYFVARELFKWPPRWVMLPQAPFEPTYRIFNFNTMPLYPILIGLGRLVGIDGSHAIKLWPLGAWALSGSLLVWALLAEGLPALGAAMLGAAFALDPELRWASVLVRPESLIGLFGMALVLGLALGFPARLRERKLFDPVALLLALAAYSHFNAIHLVFPVVVALAPFPRRLVRTGLRTVLYLAPWWLTVLSKLSLFTAQMSVQWRRLAVPNSWLETPRNAIGGLFQSMGNPVPWGEGWLVFSGTLLWLVIFAAVALLAYGLFRWVRDRAAWKPAGVDLLPAAAWVLSACWLVETKPEVWFVYYIHVALWCLMGLLGLAAWRTRSRWALSALAFETSLVAAVFLHIDSRQLWQMSEVGYWNWDTYHHWVDCVDRQLTGLEARLPHTEFRVWCPTWPDITVELSRRHPNWDLTRTNDFWDRAPLAIQHGNNAEAVVVTESINLAEREIDAPMSQNPTVLSIWMTWREHFLNTLWTQAGWKPDRYLCQTGRWQAFIFMKEPPHAANNAVAGH
jgi:hypothetical protein